MSHEKLCKKCKIIKPLNLFPSDISRKDKLHPYCRECRIIEQRQRNKKNYEKRWNSENRKCLRCGEIKPVLKFLEKPDDSRRYIVICLDCKKISKDNEKKKNAVKSSQRYYKTRIKTLKWEREKLYQIKTEIINKMGGKCQSCGIIVNKKYPAACFDFHHIERNKKEICISKIIRSYKKNSSKIHNELNKCIVLCSNCHRKKHYLEGGFYASN